MGTRAPSFPNPALAVPATKTRCLRLRGTWADVFVFLLSASSFAEIELIGRLFVPDILLLVALPFLVLQRGKKLGEPLPRIFIALGAAWLLSQMITDIVQSSPFNDYARGWAKIGFTLINFCALYLLILGRYRRIVLYAGGLAVGGLLGYFLNPDIYAFNYPWKFGYGGPITLFIVLLVSGPLHKTRFRQLLQVILLLVAAIINIYMGLRSLGGVCILASAYVGLQILAGGKGFGWGHLKIRYAMLVGVVILAAGWWTLQIYEHAAQSGYLGLKAAQHYETQAAGEYGVLLGGRTEILGSGRAILDSPLIGHGSWAKDCKYASLMVEIKRDLGYFPGAENEKCLIPAHSYLFGAWVEAGLVGAIFWLWVLSLAARVLLRLYRTLEPLTPLMAFIAFSIIWSIFFSPYGAEGRFTAPFYVIVMMTFLETYAQKTTQVARDQ